jgi:hypothetical protein
MVVCLIKINARTGFLSWTLFLQVGLNGMAKGLLCQLIFFFFIFFFGVGSWGGGGGGGGKAKWLLVVFQLNLESTFVLFCV